MSPDKDMLDALRIDRAKAQRGGRRTALVLILLALVGAGVGLAWWLNRPKPAVVRTVVVQEAGSVGEERTLLNASGYVTARRAATVSSKVTGKVVEVMVEEGMKVEAGQMLAKIDSSNVERSLHLAQAQLESARKALGETQANLEQAEREYRRISGLAAQHSASQVELDRAETDAKSLRARLARQTADIGVSERELAIWQQQLEDTVIRAPFGGVVTTKNAQPGEMISPMSVGGFTRTGICTIVDMSSLEIDIDVSESYINRVEPGQPVEATLDSYPNWRIPAKVIAIIPTADRQKATVKVRVGFDKLDPRILPDMSVKVAFRSAEGARPWTPLRGVKGGRDSRTSVSGTDGSGTSTRSAGEPTATRRSVTLPKSAIHQREGRDIVWIVRDGRVERRAVTVGEVVGSEVTIAAGVSGGERVVVEGPADLADGAAVVVKP